SPKQTVYPDFWLSSPSSPDKDRVAIDIKTTYRKSANAKFGFTLGSYTSFLRNGTKNIAGSYDMYKTHLIIGFVYTRSKKYSTQILSLNDLNSIYSPVEDVNYFVAEKYKISGEKPGSGNTANIGTFSSNNIMDFENEKGPFAQLGNDVFEDYWKNYPTPSERSNNNVNYTNLKEYVSWKKTIDPVVGTQLQQKIANLGLMLQ
uniref:type II restriction endonuclease n=1 Tax=Bartonella sp. CL63NXGY TaxID=3243538 RepID=UPI0035D0CF4D